MAHELFNRIRDEYDPDGLTQVDEDPAEVLAIFRACDMGEPCTLTLADVRQYIEELREAEAARQDEIERRTAEMDRRLDEDGESD